MSEDVKRRVLLRTPYADLYQDTDDPMCPPGVWYFLFGFAAGGMVAMVMLAVFL